MPRILYQSDLHVEFYKGNISYQIDCEGADIIVLAGDIGDSTQKSLDWVLKAAQGIPTVMCLGNHEAYDTALQQALRFWKDGLAGSHVHLLENHSVEICGVQFIGATLWTDYAVHGEDTVASAMEEAGRRMNDHRLIQFEAAATPRLFTPEDALAAHRQSIKYLRSAMAKPFEGKRVVVSHHAPSIQSIPAIYRDHNLCGAFCSDLEMLMLEHKPDAWIHGHLHMNFDYRVGQTRVVCNPHGYFDHELNKDFDPKAMLNL